MDDIHVETSVLRIGAQQADAVAGGVGVAKQAGGAALAPGAFGLLCSPLLLPPYLLVQQIADQMLGAAQTAIKNSAANLRTVANSFDEMEQENVAQLEQWASLL